MSSFSSGARRSSVVRVFAHGAMDLWIDPSWCNFYGCHRNGPVLLLIMMMMMIIIALFSNPTSTLLMAKRHPTKKKM